MNQAHRIVWVVELRTLGPRRTVDLEIDDQRVLVRRVVALEHRAGELLAQLTFASLATLGGDRREFVDAVGVALVVGDGHAVEGDRPGRRHHLRRSARDSRRQPVDALVEGQRHARGGDRVAPPELALVLVDEHRRRRHSLESTQRVLDVADVRVLHPTLGAIGGVAEAHLAEDPVHEVGILLGVAGRERPLVDHLDVVAGDDQLADVVDLVPDVGLHQPLLQIIGGLHRDRHHPGSRRRRGDERDQGDHDHSPENREADLLRVSELLEQLTRRIDQSFGSFRQLQETPASLLESHPAARSSPRPSTRTARGVRRAGDSPLRTRPIACCESASAPETPGPPSPRRSALR